MQGDERLYRKGKSFEQNKGINERKAKGVFYTPLAIVEYMVEGALSTCRLWENPYIRILDPSCGAGYFLLKAIEVLERKFIDALDKIIENHKELENTLRNGNIKKFIAENLIWGADIDPEAVRLTKSAIMELAGQECKPNIICCDSLTSGLDILDNYINEFWNQDYNYILGNPPYIGHKGVDNSYKKILHKLYSDVYKDKSDILYCFIKRSIDLLSQKGTMSFICSRYFMEGPSAVSLRKYITDNCRVAEIIDFQGCEVFADAGVASCIITLKKEADTQNTKICKISSYSPDTKFRQQVKQTFSLSQDMLMHSGWLLITSEQYELYKIIEQKGTHELAEIMDSYQGIITGCDKAFVVESEAIKRNKLEAELLKPWIKNKNVHPNIIKPPNQYIIYADCINEESQYPNSIKYIYQYEEKLLQRRECKKGIRDWYRLQWGRKHEVFDSSKIVYPYKSATNRFAVDNVGYYCSADVYSLVIKEKFADKLSLEYIAAILNSKLIEFYFKCFAKKLSNKLYDYYPNTVLKIRIIADSVNEELKKLSQQLISCKNEENITMISSDIDRELYKIYGLNEKQINILQESLK